MSSTLGVIDIITESEDILVKLIDILECDLDSMPSASPLKLYMGHRFYSGSLISCINPTRPSGS